MRWCSGDGGDGDGDDDDDDPDEVQHDDDEDGDDLPPSGREFPRQISPCRRAFSLSVLSASWRRRNISSMALPVLGFSGGLSTRRESARGGPERPHHAPARQRWGPRRGVVWAPRGPSQPPLLADSIFWKNRDFCLLENIFRAPEI